MDISEMSDAMVEESQIKSAVRPFMIAMDYDDTFTSCPETWTSVINVLRRAGAHVVCVTSRTPEMKVRDFPGNVFYCSGKPKSQAMHEQGIEIKIWIDDQPEYIGENPDRLLLKNLTGIK